MEEPLVDSFLTRMCGRETAFLFAAEYHFSGILAHLAIQPDVINTVNRQQSTALRLALGEHSLAAVGVLLSSGRDVHANVYERNTSLQRTAKFRSPDDILRAQFERDWPFLRSGIHPNPSLLHALDHESNFSNLLSHIDSGKGAKFSVDLDQALKEIQPDLIRCISAAIRGDGRDRWLMAWRFIRAARNQNIPLVKAFLVGGIDPDIPALGSTALHYALLDPTSPNKQMLQSLLAANASVFIPDNWGLTIFNKAESLHNSEIAGLVSNHILSQSFEAFNKEGGASLLMLVNSPLTVSADTRLCDVLVDSVDEFYLLLDEFQNPGFAIGFDILSEDMILSDPSALPFFTGIDQPISLLIIPGRREMLWIEYDSTPSQTQAVVETIIEKIAKIITPFPVAAYDIPEFGIGVVAHDGFYPGYDDESSATSSNLSREVTPMSMMSPSINLPQTSTGEITPMSQLVSENTSPTDNHDADSSHSSEATSAGADGANMARAEDSDVNDRNEGPRNRQTNRGSGDGGEDEEDDDEDRDHPPTPPPDPPGTAHLHIPSNTFTGKARLNFGLSRTQELSTSFDLRIIPSPKGGKINCAILIDDLVVRASEHNSHRGGLPLEARYVTNRVTLTVGPSGPCSPPRNVFPLLPYFTEKQTISVSRRYGAALQASMPPSFTFQGFNAKGKAVDRRPITIAVEPIDIRAGKGDGMVWEYKTNFEGESHLELSTDHPPEHKVSYRISSHSRMPDNFKIRLEVSYQRRRIPRRLMSKFNTPIFRFLRDVTPRDLVMTLEATIKNDGDNFTFPSITKGGRDVELDLNFMDRGGCDGQGVPTANSGLIKCDLSTRFNTT